VRWPHAGREQFGRVCARDQLASASGAVATKHVADMLGHGVLRDVQLCRYLSGGESASYEAEDIELPGC
jgi:hypothetical protein